MNLTLVVEQSEGVLNPDAYGSYRVESPERGLNRVRDLGLALRPEFHQYVVRALLDAHYLRHSVPDLQNFGEIRAVLDSQRDVDLAVFKDPSRGYPAKCRNGVQLDPLVGIGIVDPPAG